MFSPCDGIEVSPDVMASSDVETIVEARGAAAGAKWVFCVMVFSVPVSAKVNIDLKLTTHSARNGLSFVQLRTIKLVNVM
jgi:hypothetical protein